jgi:hypothetical protein
MADEPFEELKRLPPAGAAMGEVLPSVSFNRAAELIWKDHLTELEQWAKANQKDARNDTFEFWALKVPAIVASASAGIWAHFEWTTVSVIAGAVESQVFV